MEAMLSPAMETVVSDLGRQMIREGKDSVEIEGYDGMFLQRIQGNIPKNTLYIISIDRISFAVCAADPQ